MTDSDRRTERIDYDNGGWAEIDYLGDQRHGLWTVYYANGQKNWERELVHDRREGWQRSWAEDGTLLEEHGYHLGVPHGPWRYYYSNGVPKSETTFQFGYQHGRCACWNEAGELTAEGEYQDGEPWCGRFLLGVWDREAREVRETLKEYRDGIDIEAKSLSPAYESASWDLLCDHRCLELEDLTTRRVEEVVGSLRRDVVHFGPGGAPDLSNTNGSFLGWVNIGREGESWPTSEGLPLAPLLQFNCRRTPVTLAGFEDLSALTVFVDPSDMPCRIGRDLVVRAYGPNEELCELQAPASTPRHTQPSYLRFQACRRRFLRPRTCHRLFGLRLRTHTERSGERGSTAT